MLVLHAGTFGQAVADTLARHCAVDSAPLTDCQAFQTFVGDRADRLIIFALDRPHPELLEQIDDILESSGLRWTAVTLRHRTLICGPLHKPGLGPCWRCFHRRYLTLTLPPYTPEIERAYDRACDTGLMDEAQGFLPTLVDMATAQIIRHELDYDSLTHGTMSVFDIFDGSLTPTKVVPLHGCRCRPTESGAGPERFVMHLRTILADGSVS